MEFDFKCKKCGEKIVSPYSKCEKCNYKPLLDRIFKCEKCKTNIVNPRAICNNCGYMKPIPEGTLIFSKVSTDIAQSYSTSDFKDMVYSDILPRTRKYICPNTKCESHTNPQKKEASFFRMNNTFKVKYVCQTCSTVFNAN